MNFIAKHIQSIGLVMLTGFVATAAALYWDVPSRQAKLPIPATSAAEHAGCNHAGTPTTDAEAHSGCAHEGGGCCPPKATAAAPATGGCTRELVTATDDHTP